MMYNGICSHFVGILIVSSLPETYPHMDDLASAGHLKEAKVRASRAEAEGQSLHLLISHLL